AKVTDTPLAGATHDPAAPTSTELGRIVGTPAYMSPEQAAGEAVDARSDLFSLGVMLYELVTGERPFRGATSMEVMIAVARDAAAPPSSLNRALPPAIDRLVARCLAKRATERFSSARELLVELDAIGPPRSDLTMPV